jgi:hypothetical protein
MSSQGARQDSSRGGRAPLPTDAWVDLLFSTDPSSPAPSPVARGPVPNATGAVTVAPTVDLRAAAFKVIELGLRFSGEESECPSRVIARHAANWLRQLVKEAPSVPTLPTLPPLDPQEQARKTEAAKALFKEWQRQDQFRYRRHAS